MPTQTNVGSGGAVDMSYNQRTTIGTSHVNEETAIFHRFLIDSGILSVDDDVMLLVEVRWYLCGHVALYDKLSCYAYVDDRDCRQSKFLVACNKDLLYWPVVCIRHRVADIVSCGCKS